MALTNKVAVGTNAAVSSPGTAVTPTIGIFDNTHTIIIYNADTTNDIYVGFVDSSATSVPVAEAIFVPPESSITLAIGPLSARPPTGVFKVDASGGTPTARITYVNGTSA